MPLAARALMAGLALFMVWTMVRGFRTGIVYDETWTFDESKNPMMFALTMAVRGVGVVFFLWLAAGYDADSFLRASGLGWLLPWLKS
jgi:hypothetical protein